MIATAPILNFGNLPPEDSDIDNARAIVLPVPYEGTTSYGHGTKDGPMAILRASAQVELYDDELDWSPVLAGIATAAEVPISRKDYFEPVRQARQVVEEALSRDLFPVMLGGEHTISLGAIEAARATYPDLCVLQIDAHADLRAEYEETPASHASVMRRVCELGVPLVQVAIRNVSAEEMAYWKDRRPSAIFWDRTWHSREWGPADVFAALPSRHVYVTIDLDGLDPADMPAVGTPEPGGLRWHEVLDVLRPVFREKDVVAADVVELMPIPGLTAPDFLAAKLVYKLIGYKFNPAWHPTA